MGPAPFMSTNFLGDWPLPICPAPFIIIFCFTSILTVCNYLFITPVYFGGLWYKDVADLITLESFIPGLPFKLGYGASVAFIYIPFNAIKGLLVLSIYEVMAPRLFIALNKILKK